METTDTAIETVNTLADNFYTPIDISLAVGHVSHYFFILMAVLLSVYPFLYILKKLIRYCESAFDLQTIRDMEGGSVWKKIFPDSSLQHHANQIEQTSIFTRFRK